MGTDSRLWEILFAKTLAAIMTWSECERHGGGRESQERFNVLWEIIEEAGLEEAYQNWKGGVSER